MKKMLSSIFLSFLFLKCFSQYELNESTKTSQSIAEFFGKLLAYVVIGVIIYFIYRALSKKK